MPMSRRKGRTLGSGGFQGLPVRMSTTRASDEAAVTPSSRNCAALFGMTTLGALHISHSHKRLNVNAAPGRRRKSVDFRQDGERPSRTGI
jgi:hypothetical protein